MSSRTQVTLAFVLILSAVFGGVVVLAARFAPRHTTKAHQTMDAFFGAAQKRDYRAAYSYLSPVQRADLPFEQFQNQWRKFESQHGPLQKWRPLEGGGAGGVRVNLWPPFVDATMLAEGTGKGNEVFALRLAPKDGDWHIERLRLMVKNEFDLK